MHTNLHRHSHRHNRHIDISCFRTVKSPRVLSFSTFCFQMTDDRCKVGIYTGGLSSPHPETLPQTYWDETRLAMKPCAERLIRLYPHTYLPACLHAWAEIRTPLHQGLVKKATFWRVLWVLSGWGRFALWKLKLNTANLCHCIAIHFHQFLSITMRNGFVA